ncbi:MAG: glycoside hydrolase family protein [Cyanobacteria bacterium J06600_6]
MPFANQVKNFFYLGCLILILSQLGGMDRSERSGSWQRSRQLWSRLSQFWGSQPGSPSLNSDFTNDIYGTQPLAMEGGDPYIRALMRTITASEANVSRPYHVIYGGKLVDDLQEHPQLCVTIVAGPNRGNCTTAAGRYQMLDFTWDRTAQQYHPQPSGFWRWKSYSFEAKYQDAVVHAWLSDSNAWSTNIPEMLRQGEINSVLRLLSGTWTSLGYGIETNSMSSHLPQIYQNMLQEELG